MAGEGEGSGAVRTVAWSMTTSGGLRAGDSTKAKLGSLRGGGVERVKTRVRKRGEDGG